MTAMKIQTILRMHFRRTLILSLMSPQSPRKLSCSRAMGILHRMGGVSRIGATASGGITTRVIVAVQTGRPVDGLATALVPAMDALMMAAVPATGDRAMALARMIGGAGGRASRLAVFLATCRRVPRVMGTRQAISVPVPARMRSFDFCKNCGKKSHNSNTRFTNCEAVAGRIKIVDRVATSAAPAGATTSADRRPVAAVSNRSAARGAAIRDSSVRLVTVAALMVVVSIGAVLMAVARVVPVRMVDLAQTVAALMIAVLIGAVPTAARHAIAAPMEIADSRGDAVLIDPVPIDRVLIAAARTNGATTDSVLKVAPSSRAGRKGIAMRNAARTLEAASGAGRMAPHPTAGHPIVPVGMVRRRAPPRMSQRKSTENERVTQRPSWERRTVVVGIRFWYKKRREFVWPWT
jgi:hypothetical protein